MGKLMNALVTIGIIGFVIYNQFPQYHEFNSGQFDVQSGDYRYYQIDSEGPSPVKLEIKETTAAKGMDVYLVNEAEFEKLQEWMTSDDTDQPDVRYVSSWINVKEVDQDSLVLSKGIFFVIIDNTILGSENGEGNAITGDFVFSEEY